MSWRQNEKLWFANTILTGTLTLFSLSSLHSGLWLGLAAHTGEQTGREHREQRTRGGLRGARQPGHTGAEVNNSIIKSI